LIHLIRDLNDDGLHCRPETRIGLARPTRAASDRGDSEIHRRDIRAQAAGARVRRFIFKANSVEEFCEAVRIAAAIAELKNGVSALGFTWSETV
jgi:hypothetical protein